MLTDPGVDKASDPGRRLGVGQVTRGDGSAGQSRGIQAGQPGSVESGIAAEAGTRPAGGARLDNGRGDGFTQRDFPLPGPEDDAIYLVTRRRCSTHSSRLGDHPHDLDDATTWCRRALEAADDGDSNRSSYASDKAMVLVERHERDNRLTDLDEALALFEWRWPRSRPSAARFVALRKSGPGSAQFAAPRASVADLTCRNGGLAGCGACL